MIKNDECNDNQNDKKRKKNILTWPSLWLQVFHNSTRTVFIDLERFLTYLVPFAYMVHKTLFICMKSPEIAA